MFGKRKNLRLKSGIWQVRQLCVSERMSIEAGDAPNNKWISVRCGINFWHFVVVVGDDVWPPSIVFAVVKFWERAERFLLSIST